MMGTPSRLFVSFSGGETSAYMAQMMTREMDWAWDEILVMFANTGQENEETLEFVQQCDQAFGLNVVWVEAAVDPRKGKATGHQLVDFASADRTGQRFEEVIQKYGIPNHAYPHCTRELKLRPMRSYLRAIGWEDGSYDTAVGIRVDEIDRISSAAKASRLVYPLADHLPTTKPEVNAWWQAQPFRLQLKGYEGNCRWCWKKSLRKHYTLLWDDPRTYDFPERMEAQYGLNGHNLDGNPRVFFRGNKTAGDLRREAEERRGDMAPAHDDARVYPAEFDPELDVSNGCSESCEVDFTESE